jgi:hypothetical protein
MAKIVSNFKNLAIFAAMVAAAVLHLGCSKESVTPSENQNDKVLQVENVVISAKTNEFKTFTEVQAMLAGLGTLNIAPADYKGKLPKSDRYKLWIFQESSTGKITEIYVCNSLNDARITASENGCDKIYFVSGNEVCCKGSGTQCKVYVDECGDVCIVLCLA